MIRIGIYGYGNLGRGIESAIRQNPDMSLVAVEYTFDNSKLIFYFTCETRVDFRELVKDLASTFHTRIELRQIGIRDEAKMMGGLGICGRKLCCAGFLTDFVQVSIKMAKEQNFSLNSSKVSGTCGRLMCCLRYEHETYEEALRNTPPVGSVVKTNDGVGTVTETRPLLAEIKVKLDEADKDAPKLYKCSEVKVLRLPAKKDNKAEEIDNSEE
jgi:cell fate regulator YaaT (PSP1 superfamily)